ncbi:MAG: hypothetical protein ACREXV_14210 [Polaromonas sp.]
MTATTASTYTGDWIATWAASPQPIWDSAFPVPIDFPRNLRNQTIRQVARVSIGGDQLRVVLSNEYGTKPLVIGEARVAHADGGASVVSASSSSFHQYKYISNHAEVELVPSEHGVMPGYGSK